MQDLISIIVPIYKVEKYLRQCLDSIINQTYSNLEIILVDDGSPDNCGVICDEYALQDSRIRVIHLENSGVSAARNAGMEIMTGKYLMFVDSDDWMEHDAVELLYSVIKKHDASLVVGGHKQIEDVTGRLIFTNCHGQVVSALREKTEEMNAMLLYGCCVWARLYRRELFHEIVFPPITCHEDEAIMLPILERCEKIVRINAPIYNYRCRENSAITSGFSEKRLSWYEEGKKQLVWIRQYHPELEESARLRFYTSIHLHLMEMTMVDKKYWKYTKPLLQDLRENYSDMKRLFQEKGRSTIRLKLMRWLPYPVFYYLIRGGRILLRRNNKN
jgi:glycosyltransferase involved in cell wall biosynthesis